MKRLPHANASALTFSVVIPVWNGSAHLAKCLHALAASTRKPDEIVVVDDGSDDDSAAVARAHGSKVVCVAGGTIGTRDGPQSWSERKLRRNHRFH